MHIHSYVDLPNHIFIAVLKYIFTVTLFFWDLFHMVSPIFRTVLLQKRHWFVRRERRMFFPQLGWFQFSYSAGARYLANGCLEGEISKPSICRPAVGLKIPNIPLWKKWCSCEDRMEILSVGFFCFWLLNIAVIFFRNSCDDLSTRELDTASRESGWMPECAEIFQTQNLEKICIFIFT